MQACMGVWFYILQKEEDVKGKIFSTVIWGIAACMLSFSCAHNEITDYNHNMDQLEQKALNSADGKAHVRAGARFNAKIGGKHAGVIDAPADVVWDEVKKLMDHQQRLYAVYTNIPFTKSIDIENNGGDRFSINYHYKALFVPVSIIIGFYVDDQNRFITGNKTGGSFWSFVVDNDEHDIGVIPIDDNKSLLVVRFLESYIFPASVDAGIGASMIGANNKICPKMTSAFIDEVRASVRRR